LSKEDIILDIIIKAMSLQLKNVIKWAMSKIPMSKAWHKILNVGRKKSKKSIHQPMKLCPLQFCCSWFSGIEQDLAQKLPYY
jgi:hypothetical protein